MKTVLLRAVALLSLINTSTAQMPGSLDAAFGSGGVALLSGGSWKITGHALALQADGKILVAGQARSADFSQEDFALARFNADGSVDAGFGTNGLVVTDLGPASSDEAHAVAVQSDGKIVVAGYTYLTGFDVAIARYLPNGSLDNSFGTGGIVKKNFISTDFALALVVTPAGKILAGGRAYNGSNSDFALLQLNTDGTNDNGFGTNGAVTIDFNGSDDNINALALQPDGKIIAAGDRSQNGSSVFALARLLPNGALDNSFDGDGKTAFAILGMSDVIYAATVQLDGKIVVAGQSNSTDISDFALARLLPNGALDNSFDGDGKLTTSVTGGGDYAYGVAVQTDGKILAGGTVAGNGSISDFALARYLPNGALDSGFGAGGKVVTDINAGADVARAMRLHQGNILLAGESDKSGQSSFAVVKYRTGSVVKTAEFESLETSVYPNPATERVELSAAAQEGRFDVFSSGGQWLAAWEWDGAPISISVADWPAGLYYIRFGNANTLSTTKLVVQK